MTTEDLHRCQIIIAKNVLDPDLAHVKQEDILQLQATLVMIVPLVRVATLVVVDIR